jgi:hypothetical protein
MTPNGSQDIMEVLREPDVFKLAIRGHAIVEDEVDATSAISFRPQSTRP